MSRGCSSTACVMSLGKRPSRVHSRTGAAAFAFVLFGILGVGYGCGARSDLGVLVNDASLEGGQDSDWIGHLDGEALDGFQHPQPDAGAIPVVHAGSLHYCARLPNASVKCWGSNDSAQLGDGTKIDRESAVSVLGVPTGVIDVRGGQTNSCTLDAEGGGEKEVVAGLAVQTTDPASRRGTSYTKLRSHWNRRPWWHRPFMSTRRRTTNVRAAAPRGR